MDSEGKNSDDNFKFNENNNIEIENLSNNSDDLNYLDNYDELEEDKIVEMFDGLNLEANNKEKNHKDKKIENKKWFTIPLKK